MITNNRIKIKVFGANELIPPLEVFDFVSNGGAEIGQSGSYYWKGKSQACQFFSSVPFGMTANELNAWIDHGGGKELWNKLSAQFNVISFQSANTGVQMGGWFNKEITNIVFMGMGEPFLNYLQVINAAKLFNHRDGINLSSQRITISTVGIIPKIKQYSEEGHKYKLAISLNSNHQSQRVQIMPISKIHSINDLIKSVWYYHKKSKRLATFANMAALVSLEPDFCFSILTSCIYFCIILS